MKRLIPFAIGLILIGLLVVFNKRFNNGTEPSEEEVEQQRAQAQKPAPPPPVPSGPPALTLPSDEVLGNPGTAKYKVVFGYTVNEGTQANTQALLTTVNAVRAAVKGRPDVSAVIADVDVPAADRAAPAQAITQEGLTVNGVPTDSAKLPAVLKP